MDSGFNGPAEVGFENIDGKCWASSFVQAIYACKPLLRRILTVECKNVLVIELKKALRLLKEKKRVLRNGYDYSEVAISVEEVNLLYNEVYDITNTPRESRLGEVTKFLTALNRIYNMCGFNNSFFNYYDIYPFVLMQSKEIDINVFIKQQQASILSHLSHDNPEFIIFGCLFGRTRITRQISIGPHRFQICAIIFSIEGGGHFYTVTNYGRYDDITVEVGPGIMEQYIKNGYDNHNGRKDTGHLFFFELIGSGAAAAALPPPPPPPENPECGICGGEIHDDVDFYECPVHHIAHERCANLAENAILHRKILKLTSDIDLTQNMSVRARLDSERQTTLAIKRALENKIEVDRQISELTSDINFAQDRNAQARLELERQKALAIKRTLERTLEKEIDCWACKGGGIMTKKQMTQLEKKKFQKINADYEKQEQMQLAAEARQQAMRQQGAQVKDYEEEQLREALALSLQQSSGQEDSFLTSQYAESLRRLINDFKKKFNIQGEIPGTIDELVQKLSTFITNEYGVLISKIIIEQLTKELKDYYLPYRKKKEQEQKRPYSIWDLTKRLCVKRSLLQEVMKQLPLIIY
jgi:hypothetical protein